MPAAQTYRHLFAVLIAMVSLSSCFKEKPYNIKPPVNNGDTYVASLGYNYARQIYFNLQTGAFTGNHSRMDWDMAFSAKDGSYLAFVNGSRLMQVATTGIKVWDQVNAEDTLTAKWRVEYGSEVADSNAIGKWFDPYLHSLGEVFLLNMGYDTLDNPLGYKKLQFSDYTDGYIVTYANLDGSDKHTVKVQKSDYCDKVYLHFATEKVQSLEPVQDNWDLIFTQYSIYFSAQNLPYKVTGILTNPYRTQAYFMDSTSDFTKITKADVKEDKFQPVRDGIGYEWKHLEAGYQYSSRPNFNYIVKSGGRYYKFRVLLFYNENGEKGYPKFEYVEIT